MSNFKVYQIKEGKDVFIGEGEFYKVMAEVAMNHRPSKMTFHNPEGKVVGTQYWNEEVRK